MGTMLGCPLKQDRTRVIGVSRSKGDWLRGDVKDRRLVEHLIRDMQSELIYHLAVNSTISHNGDFSRSTKLLLLER
jgi:hypothetical protein